MDLVILSGDRRELSGLDLSQSNPDVNDSQLRHDRKAEFVVYDKQQIDLNYLSRGPVEQ
ncbi:hypothetical protein J6590_068800 [Homalodisca vitripennis]|nr:hypothetical protein J6590_068800 [Homalodisca vitripennis]